MCVEKYCEAAGFKLKDLNPADTPCLYDHQISAEDFEIPGALALHAAQVVLRVLYSSRTVRADELWTVNTLARNVTRWTVACDKRLDRLMRYIHHNSDLVLKCVVGDKVEDCSIALFCDASFAGDLTDSKSTSGAYLAIFGPRTFVPITWFCKKQTAVSHSSTEAEVLSLDTSVRMEGLPTLELMEKIIEVFGPKLTSTQVKTIRDQQQKHLRRKQ